MNADESPQMLPVSEVLDALWIEIRRILGATMAAALFRRTIAECGGQSSPFARIDLRKDGLSHTYSLPADIEDDPDVRAELPRFVDTLLSLLSRISGDVLVSILLKNSVIRETAGKEWSDHG